VKAERRQHPRYPIREGEFEIFSRDSEIIGTLYNISRGGLAFQYSPVAGQRAESEAIDIMVKGSERFYLPAVACRTIYDISVLAEARTFTGAATRLCGVKFAGLTRDREQALMLFIENCGLVPSEDSRRR
jgi:hypothetical protein